MATQNLLRIFELDGSGDLTGYDRSLKSTDDLVVPANTTTFSNSVDFDAGMTLAAAQAIAGNGALTISSAAAGDIHVHSDGDIIVELGDAAGANSFLVRDSGGAGSVASIDSDGNLVLDGNLTIAGNITFTGSATSLTPTVLTTADPLFLVNAGYADANPYDLGWIGERGTAQNIGVIWDESADVFAFILTDSTGTETGNVTIADYASLHAGGLTLDDTFAVTGASTFTAAADFDGGMTIAAGQSILGDGALTFGVATGAFDITVKMGDALGAQKVSFVDSAAAEQASINSDGLLTTKSFTLTSGATVTAILDEDNMASDSATALATQQSIKAYVDAAAGATTLAALTDVTITAVANDEILQYTGAGWENQTLAEAGIQGQADVLDDLAATGANAADGEFLVGTGAGALAWESGATVRTSLGLGTGDSPTFTGLTLSGEVLVSGYTAAAANAASNNLLFCLVDEGGALKARTPDVSGTGSFATARINGVWRTGGYAVRHDYCASVLIEDNVAVAIGDPLYASTSTDGRVTVAGGTGMPASGTFKAFVGYSREAIAADADQGGGAGVDRVVKFDLMLQPPVQI